MESTGWAVTIEGRSDRRGIVLLVEDRAKAESIATEICARGSRVVVMPYPPTDRVAPSQLSGRPVP